MVFLTCGIVFYFVTEVITQFFTIINTVWTIIYPIKENNTKWPSYKKHCATEKIYLLILQS